MAFSSYILYSVALTLFPTIHAQEWFGFSESCSSWQGIFGTQNGVNSVGGVTLTATCSSVSGDQIFSSLDLNNCYGLPSPQTIVNPGSGLFDTCVVTNEMNSILPQAGMSSGTVLNLACPKDSTSVYLISLDINDDIGNNNGVLAC
ncbi:hypothetical protein CPC08DRAFT_711406 [Agrocybe pediades]|nr:hypothetical protein CPC08DRAFT_711406 [Agrocybe pediades]